MHWFWPSVAGLMLVATSGGRAQAPARVSLPAGTEILLVTVDALSSKKQVKGDPVSLQVMNDVRIEGQLLIPAGTPATGQVADARAKGAMGMSGRLTVAPLYLRIGDETVRLSGATGNKGSVSGGAIIGMVLLTPGFTGRSAEIPAGATLRAVVLRATSLPASAP